MHQIGKKKKVIKYNMLIKIVYKTLVKLQQQQQQQKMKTNKIMAMQKISLEEFCAPSMALVVNFVWLVKCLNN